MKKNKTSRKVQNENKQESYYNLFKKFMEYQLLSSTKYKISGDLNEEEQVLIHNTILNLFKEGNIPGSPTGSIDSIQNVSQLKL